MIFGGERTSEILSANVVCQLITLSILLLPLGGEAQPSSRVPTVGVLVPSPANSPFQEPSRKAFEGGLSELGWRPGETVRIEYRYAGGQAQRLDELARDLVRPGVDVISLVRRVPSGPPSMTGMVPITVRWRVVVRCEARRGEAGTHAF